MLEDHPFRDAIECIARHAITLGTGNGSTFSPEQTVTRQEMALFMLRAANVAKADLGPQRVEALDIDAAWPDARKAIRVSGAQLWGLSDGEAFRPRDAMIRAEMALTLVRLLGFASPNVTIASDGKILLGEGGHAEANDFFTDMKACRTEEEDRAAAALWELGVTNGIDTPEPPDTCGNVVIAVGLPYSFLPEGVVSRGQMAAFITRALAHTGVRPPP